MEEAKGKIKVHVNQALTDPGIRAFAALRNPFNDLCLSEIATDFDRITGALKSEHKKTQ